MNRVVITLLFITTLMNVTVSINDINIPNQNVRDSFLADLECYKNGTRMIMLLPLNDQETKLLKSVVDVKLSIARAEVSRKIAKAKAREVWMTPLLTLSGCVSLSVSFVNIRARRKKALEDISKLLSALRKLETAFYVIAVASWVFAVSSWAIALGILKSI